MAYDEDALVLADAAFKKTDLTLVMECQTGKQICQQQGITRYALRLVHEVLFHFCLE